MTDKRVNYQNFRISLPRGFDRNFDRFYEDSRFQVLVKKMGLEEVVRRE